MPLALLAVLMLMYAKQKHQFLPSSFYYYEEFENAFQEKDMDVIALGNSKLLSAIDKSILEENTQQKVAVLGYSSANISVSKLTLESYLHNCSKLPELVLLEVSWFTFNTKRTHFHNIAGDLFIRDPQLWKHYFEYSDDLAMDIKRAFLKSLGQKTSTYHKQKAFTNVNRIKAKSPLKRKYMFHVSDMEVLFPNHIAGIDEKLLKDYEAIINMCMENQIQLILFTAPEDETYSKNQKDINVIKSIFKDSSKNNPNVFYLDYSFGGDLWDKKHEFLLKDSHHINEKEVFSKILIDDIKRTLYKRIHY